MQDLPLDADIEALRHAYELRLEWEIEQYKDSIDRAELLRIGDIAIGELKRRDQGTRAYNEIDVWQAVDRVVMRKIHRAPFDRWYRRREARLKRKGIQSAPLAESAPTTIQLDQTLDVSRYDQALKSAQIIVVNDQLLSLVARDPELLYSVSSRKFEELVGDLISAQGFDVELTKATRDGGRDLIARTNGPLGPSMILVECKKYRQDRPVDVSVVRSLHGVVMHERATSGVLVTTSRFTEEAQRFQRAIPYQLALKDFGDLEAWVHRYWRPVELIVQSEFRSGAVSYVESSVKSQRKE